MKNETGNEYNTKNEKKKTATATITPPATATATVMTTLMTTPRPTTATAILALQKWAHNEPDPWQHLPLTLEKQWMKTGSANERFRRDFYWLCHPCFQVLTWRDTQRRYADEEQQKDEIWMKCFMTQYSMERIWQNRFSCDGKRDTNYIKLYSILLMPVGFFCGYKAKATFCTDRGHQS